MTVVSKFTSAPAICDAPMIPSIINSQTRAEIADFSTPDPKAIVEQCGLGEEIELEVRRDELVLRSPRAPRRGWDAAFAKMAAAGDDELLEMFA